MAYLTTGELEQKTQQWLMRENEGLNAQEQKELDAWLETNAHREAYLQQKRIICACLDLDEAFVKELENDILKEESLEQTGQNTSSTRRIPLVLSLVAACLVLFVSLAVKDYYFVPIFEQEYSSTDKKILNITLPDNTVVDLDIKSHAKITYYNHKKTVELTAGKAFFHVTKDPKKPFIVNAGKTAVEVVGTKFEVANIADAVSVSVLEGAVKVSVEGRAVYQLAPTQSIRLSSVGEMVRLGQVDVQKIADWKNDTLFFDKTTLRDAAAQFEYYTGKKIVFGAEGLSHLPLSGKFSTTHFKGFLDAIEVIYPLKARREGDTVVLVRK